jgi:hypothetical protein
LCFSPEQQWPRKFQQGRAYCFVGCFFTQRKPIWPWRSLAKQMSV